MMNPERSVAFFVRGVPVPQGSVTAHVAKRKDGTRFATVHYQVGSPLHRWRANVAIAARNEWGEELTYHPVRMRLEFWMPHPMRHFRLDHSLREGYAELDHDTRPDLDKLVRAILDALTDCVYEDDAQVTVVYASKAYIRSHNDPTGVGVTINAMP